MLNFLPLILINETEICCDWIELSYGRDKQLISEQIGIVPRNTSYQSGVNFIVFTCACIVQ